MDAADGPGQYGEGEEINSCGFTLLLSYQRGSLGHRFVFQSTGIVIAAMDGVSHSSLDGVWTRESEWGEANRQIGK